MPGADGADRKRAPPPPPPPKVALPEVLAPREVPGRKDSKVRTNRIRVQGRPRTWWSQIVFQVRFHTSVYILQWIFLSVPSINHRSKPFVPVLQDTRVPFGTPEISTLTATCVHGKSSRRKSRVVFLSTLAGGWRRDPRPPRVKGCHE